VPDLETIEDRLAGQALQLVTDVRDDLAAAHRTVRVLDHLELEQLCCVLAAMVDPTKTLAQMAWWRRLPEFQGSEAA
jgi:hypothetical protein